MGNRDTHPADMNRVVEDILRGAWDLHVHAGPDPWLERRVDALDCARYAQEAEMSGFVLKSHAYSTASLAHTLNTIYPGLSVCGSVCLNREVGGLNPDAVESAARLGATVVWMPTRAAKSYLHSQGQCGGLEITDDTGSLLSEVQDILDIVHTHDMILASGHVSPSEAIRLFGAAGERGINRMIATHPDGIASVDQQREMASLGAHLEYTFLSCMPSVRSTTPEKLAGDLRALGIERCVVTTDFGQWVNPPPAEGMRMAIAALLQAGLGPDEVSILVKDNPARLLGIGD